MAEADYMAKQPPELPVLAKLSPPQLRAISGLLRRVQNLRTGDRELTPVQSYSFRPSTLGAERHYFLTTDGLTCLGRKSGNVAYRDVAKVKIYQTRFLGSSKSYWACTLFSYSGKKIHLAAAHHQGLRKIEDRSPTYLPFFKELEARIAAANPNAHFIGGRSWLNRIESAVGHSSVQILRALRTFDSDRVTKITVRTLRIVGPRLRGHRTARAQLKSAFPEKNPDEIEKILRGMWSNIGTITAEYAHLDQLWDFDPMHPERSKHILIDDQVIERCRQLERDREPVLLFSGHLANWEIPARAAAAFGRNIAIVYRQPRIRSFAAELAKLRSGGVAELIPAGFQAPLKIRNAIRRNYLIGILVDQFDAKGIDVTFFGRRCRVSSLFARTARLFECPIHGSRVIRLPNGRYRFELTEPLVPPRDPSGMIDVGGTMQLITSIMENWIREHPDQWMWTQRLWR